MKVTRKDLSDRANRIAPSSGPARCGRASGFTLTEMLAVIVIIMLIGGISAGVFQIAHRNFELAASASKLEGLLLLARNSAIASGVPVQVVVDPANRRARAHSFETVGEWSFEEFGGDGVYSAPASAKGLACPGYIGTGIRLSSGDHVDCGDGAQFDLISGLLIEAWVSLEAPLSDAPRPTPRPTSTSRRRSYKTTKSKSRSARGSSSADVGAILSKRKAYYFGVTADGGLEGGIGIPGSDGEMYRVRTAPEAVLPGRWTRVSMRYDGESIELSADGVTRPWSLVGYEHLAPKNQPRLPESIPIDSGPLSIGSPKGSFAGKVDEVRLRGMAQPLVFEIPEDQFLLGWKKIVWFDRRGHLDPRYHDRPVRFVLYEHPADVAVEKGKTVAFTDYSLTFEEWARQRGKDLEGLREEDQERLLEQQYEGRRRVEISIDRIGTMR